MQKRFQGCFKPSLTLKLEDNGFKFLPRIGQNTLNKFDPGIEPGSYGWRAGAFSPQLCGFPLIT